jgi:uncharacterized protein (DUF4415 family)
MKKETEALPKKLRDELEALETMSDKNIDRNDIPETTDFSQAVWGRFYKPVKQQVTLRLDADVLDWFKRQAKNGNGYQTRINAALRSIVEQETRRAG